MRRVKMIFCHGYTRILTDIKIDINTKIMKLNIYNNQRLNKSV
jgi:hypothetical protein